MTWLYRHPKPSEMFRGFPGVWLATGASTTEQYPCRCHEARFGRCHPAFCPCAGRPDPPDPECCANRFGPIDVAQASAEWREKKERERIFGREISQEET